MPSCILSISQALASQGLFGASIGGATSITGDISKPAASMMGGGVVGDLMRGAISGAGLRVLDSGLLNDFLPGMSGIASQVMYWGRPTPLFGGITPTEARQIYQTMQNTRISKKNLFLIEVSSALMGDCVSQWSNLFATELDYTPLTISGDKRKVGCAVLDSVQSSEPTELRVTTIDDQFGTIKRWYEQHHAATVSQDGTVGTPKDIVSAIQEYKIKNNDALFKSSSADVRAGTANRAVAEHNRLLSLADSATVGNVQTAHAQVPESPRMPAPQLPADEPSIVEPLASTGSRNQNIVASAQPEVGQDVKDRRIAHIVTGGLSN